MASARGRWAPSRPSLLREEGPWTIDGLAALTGVDVVIRLSREQAEPASLATR